MNYVDVRMWVFPLGNTAKVRFGRNQEIMTTAYGGTRQQSTSRKQYILSNFDNSGAGSQSRQSRAMTAINYNAHTHKSSDTTANTNTQLLSPAPNSETSNGNAYMRPETRRDHSGLSHKRLRTPTSNGSDPSQQKKQKQMPLLPLSNRDELNVSGNTDSPRLETRTQACQTPISVHPQCVHRIYFYPTGPTPQEQQDHTTVMPSIAPNSSWSASV